MKPTRTRNNHIDAKATVWDMGLSRCWKIKAPVWCVRNVTWSIGV